MKKSIATIALFTLALVTTSFTTQTSNNLSNTVSVDPPTGGQNSGGAIGGGKKLDLHAMNHVAKNTVSFGSESQSTLSNKKID